MRKSRSVQQYRIRETLGHASWIGGFHQAFLCSEKQVLPVLALIGYEPKRLIIAHLMDMAGMNPLRARSMPPVANPFWSDRIRREVDLQSHRPLTLPPVPGDDAEVSRELDGEVEPLMSGQEVLQVENRGRPRSRENDASRFMEKFGTPASWAEPTRMASSRRRGREGHGHRTEGEMPREEGEELDGAVGGGPDSLDRALEKEMMTRLHHIKKIYASNKSWRQCNNREGHS